VPLYFAGIATLAALAFWGLAGARLPHRPCRPNYCSDHENGGGKDQEDCHRSKPIKYANAPFRPILSF
jgi:hypothetical protein